MDVAKCPMDKFIDGRGDSSEVLNSERANGLELPVGGKLQEERPVLDGVPVAFLQVAKAIGIVQ